jgi:hypothetical protein
LLEKVANVVHDYVAEDWCSNLCSLADRPSHLGNDRFESTRQCFLHLVPKRGISLRGGYDTGAAARMVFAICWVYDPVDIGASFGGRQWRHICYVEPHAGTDRNFLAYFRIILVSVRNI